MKRYKHIKGFILVPKSRIARHRNEAPHSRLISGIKDGAGIIGIKLEVGFYRISYEDNNRNIEDLHEAKERIYAAAEISFCNVRPETDFFVPPELFVKQFLVVGEMSVLDNDLVMKLTDKKELNEWLKLYSVDGYKPRSENKDLTLTVST